MTEAEESHGLFQFGGSDSDDDLFATNTKQRHFIDRTYKTQPTVCGWYTTDINSIEERFSYKTGPDEIQHFIEYSYLLGRFEEALTFAKAYLDMNSRRPKPLKTWEITETATRCALRLRRYKEALELFCGQESREPGHMSLKAEIFALNGLHGESITEYIKYLTLRNRDYSAWLKISAVLSDLSSAEKSHPTRSTSLRQWAKLGFEFALDIYNRTPRSDNAIAQRNKDLEYKRIQEALSGLGDCEGQPDDECLRDYLGLSQDHVGFLRTRLSSEVVDEVDTAEKAVRDL